MEQIIRKLTMNRYKAQIVIHDCMSESLAREFERENLTLEQRAEVARQWDHVLKERQAFQLMLNIRERQWREESPLTEPSATSSAA